MWDLDLTPVYGNKEGRQYKTHGNATQLYIIIILIFVKKKKEYLTTNLDTQEAVPIDKLQNISSRHSCHTDCHSNN